VVANAEQQQQQHDDERLGTSYSPVSIAANALRVYSVKAFTLYQHAQCICARNAYTVQLDTDTYLPCIDRSYVGLIRLAR